MMTSPNKSLIGTIEWTGIGFDPLAATNPLVLAAEVFRAVFTHYITRITRLSFH